MVTGTNEFGRELRRRRTAAGLSQAGLAQLIGCTRSWLNRIESGSRNASPESALLCDRYLKAGGALAALAPEPRRRKRRDARKWALIGMPRQAECFVGRSRERVALARFVAKEHGTNLCVLTGMAGVGKTALALRAAWEEGHRMTDGCFYFDCGAHTPGASRLSGYEVLGSLLRRLGVPGEEVPADHAGRVCVYQNKIRGRRLLLVLDNVGTSDQIGTLLPADPRCRVIVASRNWLSGLDDALRIPVDTLAEHEAVELFQTIAGVDKGGARIASLCGGLPLALRVAGARFQSDEGRTLEAFEGLFTEAVSRLDVMDDGERNVAAAFAVSCDALSEEDRRLFALLALHPAGAVRTPGLAALVGVSVAQVRMGIHRLAHAHLVSYDAEDRIAVHDLLREFARDRCLPEIAETERHDALLRLTEHDLTIAESCGRLIEPLRHRVSPFSRDLSGRPEVFSDRVDAIVWMETEWPVLVELCRVAAVLGRGERCWQLASVLRDYFFLVKLWEPWIDTHRLAIDTAREGGNAAVLAAACNSLGIAYSDRGDPAAAAECFEEALSLYDALGDEHGLVNATANLAWTLLYLGRYQSALDELRLVLETYRRLGNRRAAAISLRAVALAETELNLHDQAVEHAIEALAECEAMGLPLDVVMSLNCIAWGFFQSGDLAAAELHYRRAAAGADHCGSRFEAARAMTGCGNVAAVCGDSKGAGALWTRADDFHLPLEPTMNGEARVRSTLWLGREAFPGGARGPGGE